MYTASTPILLALLASFPLALCLSPEADGTLPDLGMTYSMVHEQQRTQRISGAKNIAWTVEANQEAVLSLVVPRPVTHGQERFMAVNLSIDALDQAGRALRGDVHIMSFMDALEGDASFFHWSYPEVGGDGKCWVRVHATDKERHPCSTSHVRKHPVLYPVLYPDLY